MRGGEAVVRDDKGGSRHTQQAQLKELPEGVEEAGCGHGLEEAGDGVLQDLS
jgi:hypothetical protein